MATNFFHDNDETVVHISITPEELSEITTEFHKLGLIKTKYDLSVHQQILRITHRGLKYLIALQVLTEGDEN